MAQIGKLLVIISLLCGTAFSQSTTIRTYSSMPAHCKAGPPPLPMDAFAICNGSPTVCVFYICRQTDTPDEVITAAVALTWASVVGADTYNVYRASVSGGPYTEIKTGVVTPSYIDYLDSTQHNQTFYYVVTAVNINGESPFSTQVVANVNH